MDMKRVYLALCLVTVLALAAILMGCGRNDTTGYKEFIVSEGPVPFSLEYPVSYQKPSVDRTAEPHITSVTFIRIVWEGERYSVLSTVDVSIYDATYYSTDASALLAESLRKFEDGFLYDDFQLLERSQIIVSGIQGEEIVYSYTWTPTWRDHSTGEDPYVMRGRRIYFYSDGVIWELTLGSPLSEVEIANADFEHILETFQILD